MECPECGRDLTLDDDSFGYEYGSERGTEVRIRWICEHCEFTGPTLRSKRDAMRWES